MTIPFEESYHGLLRQHLGNRRIILPAVRAVILDEDGRILFVKRSDNGLWVMPAGGQELDESILDALHREVREESGLEVEEAELIAIYSEPRFHFTNSYGGEHQMLSFVFLVTKWHGTLRQKTDETIAAKLFPLDALPRTRPAPTVLMLKKKKKFNGKVILK